MRDRETIDSELRLIALRRQSIREQGGQLSWQQVDALLDERLGHPPEAAEAEAVAAGDTQVITLRSLGDKTDRRTRSGRKSALRRYGPLAALPLSLLAVAAVLVVMFGVHKADPAQPVADPPPSAARPSPDATKTYVPALDIADRAFIGVLQREGVPVPSNEYVTTHGHAVCDFLTHQTNLAEAVRFVQQSSIWDANQSANFAAAAVVSYCPQYETASAPEIQPGLQNSLSDLEAIERDLKRIQGDLQGIGDALPTIPGHQ